METTMAIAPIFVSAFKVIRKIKRTADLVKENKHVAKVLAARCEDLLNTIVTAYNAANDDQKVAVEGHYRTLYSLMNEISSFLVSYNQQSMVARFMQHGDNRDALELFGSQLTSLVGDLNLAVTLHNSQRQETSYSSDEASRTVRSELQEAKEKDLAAWIVLFEELQRTRDAELYARLELRDLEATHALNALSERLHDRFDQIDDRLHKHWCMAAKSMYYSLERQSKEQSSSSRSSTSSAKAPSTSTSSSSSGLSHIGRSLEVQTTEFEIEPVPFSRGKYSEVSRATWTAGTTVVIKRLFVSASIASCFESQHTSSSSVTARDLIKREARMWAGLNHENVIQLCGVCLDDPDPFLVMPYMVNGSLDAYARERPWEHLRLLMETARGMAHLHARHILHGDLCPSNILIDGAGTAKVTDFGLSRLKATRLTSRVAWTLAMANSEDSRRAPASPPGSPTSKAPDGITGSAVTFIAPELYLPGNQFVYEADVFAYAMTAYNVIAGAVPFIGQDGRAIATRIRQAERPLCPDGAPSFTAALWAVVTHSWDQNPMVRPTFSKITIALQSMLQAAPASPNGYGGSRVSVQKLAIPVNHRSGSPVSSMSLGGFVRSRSNSVGTVIAPNSGISGHTSRHYRHAIKRPELFSEPLYATLPIAWQNRMKIKLGLMKKGDAVVETIGPLLAFWDKPGLRLSKCMGPEGARILADALLSSSLSALYLSNHQLGARGVESIASVLPRVPITVLYMENAGVNDQAAIHLGEALSQSILEELGLSSNTITGIGARALVKGMKAQAKIRLLSLYNNLIDSPSTIELADALSELSLEYLDIGRNPIGASGSMALASALPDSSIHSLQFPRSLPSSSASRIAASLRSSPVTHLSLPGLNNNTLSLVAEGLPGSALDSLSLHKGLITWFGVQALTKALQYCSIRKINLASNRIDDTGARILADAMSQCTVAHLNLKTNLITGTGALFLLEVIPDSRLVHLELAGNTSVPENILDDVKEALEHARKLKVIAADDRCSASFVALSVEE